MQGSHGVGCEHVVGVGEHDVSAPRLGHSMPARRRYAPIGLVEHAHPIVVLGQRVELGGRSVGASVVDGHNLEVAEILREDALQATVYVVDLVVNRDDDGYFHTSYFLNLFLANCRHSSKICTRATFMTAK